MNMNREDPRHSLPRHPDHGRQPDAILGFDPCQFADAMQFLNKLIDGRAASERAFTAILNSLQILNGKVERIMAISQQMRDTLHEIDEATTAIGVKLDNAANQVRVGMTEAEVSEVQGTLSGASSRLKAMASDPNNPVAFTEPV